MSRLLAICVILTVLAGLVLGLMAVGGPGYARMERLDRERAQDLREFGEYHRCQIVRSEAKDADAPGVEHCMPQRLARHGEDPVTGEPYAFERLDENRFRVCATFETQIYAAEGYGFDQVVMEGQRGCILYERANPDSPFQW